jgi:asparagine synthase (glutamine-hydrolysing)
MCGILAFFDREGHYKGTPEELKKLLVELSFRQTTRGPDGSGHVGGAHWGICHERLAIMDPEGGKQPISYQDSDSHVCANGEIYNFRELLKKHDLPAKTGSDSESLLLLHQKLGPSMMNELNGIFGFVITSNDGKNIFAARDHCGIKPLYTGKGKNGEIWFASELKCIVD